jgi:predicted RNase H-like HicB family nuclease
MAWTIAVEQEGDGRWLAKVLELPGVSACGPTCPQAIGRAQALTLRLLAERLERGEEVAELQEFFSVVF